MAFYVVFGAPLLVTFFMAYLHFSFEWRKERNRNLRVAAKLRLWRDIRPTAPDCYDSNKWTGRSA